MLQTDKSAGIIVKIGRICILDAGERWKYQVNRWLSWIFPKEAVTWRDQCSVANFGELQRPSYQYQYANYWGPCKLPFVHHRIRHRVPRRSIIGNKLCSACHRIEAISLDSRITPLSRTLTTAARASNARQYWNPSASTVDTEQLRLAPITTPVHQSLFNEWAAAALSLVDRRVCLATRLTDLT